MDSEEVQHYFSMKSKELVPFVDNCEKIVSLIIGIDLNSIVINPSDNLLIEK